MKRSGLAIVQYCQQLNNWRPQAVFSAGIGLQCKEIDIMHEQWPEVPLIGWEPHPSIYEAMVGEFPGTLHDFGLASKKGVRPFFNKKLHKNGASMFSREDGTDNEVHTIDVDTLDNQIDLLLDWNDCLLWLDCEGAEYEVLTGGFDFIRKGITMINIEMTGRSGHIGWANPEEVHELLTYYGFTRVWVHSIRPPAAQYDGVYLRNGKVDNTLRIW